MLDLENFRRYLEDIGFGAIQNYIAYLNSLINILNQIDEYQALNDQDKVVKFANANNEFKNEFDQHHNYANNSTFNDFRSGARKYVKFLQYFTIMNTMQEYDEDNSSFDLNGAYMFFKVFDDVNSYPIKAICKKIQNNLELEENFTTNDAKGKLRDIFNEQNIQFFDNRNENPIEPVQNLKIKNIILYGAPGVGKTHNYKKIVALIEGGDFLENKIFDFIINNKDDEIEEGSIDRLFKQVKDEKRVEFIAFHQSYSYEDFIEGFRPSVSGNIELKDGIFKKLCSDAEKSDKNFYIVIDEINRGNISKIFGELITLIEEDKRDVYEVTLPYSKEKFKVPSNLYIIATMNSTDKSIATIDIALRRRFTFLKMKPNEDLISHVKAKELFNSLNKFIKDNLNEDYMLGHSYFMNIQNSEDLKFVKEYKIKPLLEEYFYADDENYNKAEGILNKYD
ncbi:AAA family ATPase [Sulfurimonas sp.]|uniref:McrB family protein n=1 Tax=Sulfurimonas sp. TaxID=2022749 RepID=UPI0019FE6528|nr:AAA family ATPase [Sulfurimonas sp.]MBE0513739.1 AAA family ATPase [Sulfurimonas sp.]